MSDVPKLGSDTREYLRAWAEKYRRDLTEDVLPFWLRHGLDRVHGGMYTCVDRDGSLLDSDKSVWFQGRAGWVFAAAYNRVERRPEYLEAARSCVEFLCRHCFDTDGRMFYQVAADGTPVRKRRYVFSETFAVIAFAEYARASGDQGYAARGLELFRRLVWLLQTPGQLEPKTLPTAPATRGHSACMILLNTGHCLREALPDPFIDEVVDRSLAELRTHFMKPQFRAVLETVAADGGFLDTVPGRLVNPGHSIETGWFVLEEARHRGWDAALTAQGLTIVDWAWDWGLDPEHGGITYFRDCRGRPPQEYWHDMKFWWPQNEAVVASLYAYAATRDDKYLRRHDQISRWAYARFPDPEHGEWFGYLHRDGSLSQPAKGNMYKGPFHVPRMMIKGVELCALALGD